MNANVKDAGVEEDPTLVVKDISSAHLRLMMQGQHSADIYTRVLVQITADL